MPRQLWIADKLRDYGLTVKEVDGWKTRGSTRFDPKGVIGHHTASNRRYVAPALKLCIDGRKKGPGVTAIKGPLCQILIDREAVCHVIAAGRANHAGRGGRKGLKGNSSVLGIEVENNGVGEPWSDEVLDAFKRCSAALLDGIGRDASWWMGHKEWTRRKIDPAGINLDAFRADVQNILKGAPMATVGRPVTEKEMTVLKAVQKALGVTPDGIYGPKTKAAALALRKAADEGGDSDLRAQLEALLRRK